MSTMRIASVTHWDLVGAHSNSVQTQRGAPTSRTRFESDSNRHLQDKFGTKSCPQFVWAQPDSGTEIDSQIRVVACFSPRMIPPYNPFERFGPPSNLDKDSIHVIRVHCPFGQHTSHSGTTQFGKHAGSIGDTQPQCHQARGDGFLSQ